MIEKMILVSSCFVAGNFSQKWKRLLASRLLKKKPFVITHYSSDAKPWKYEPHGKEAPDIRIGACDEIYNKFMDDRTYI